MRLKDGQLSNNVPGKPYCEWVKESIETNRPYDRFVYELLTAEGKIWDNPACGYILRDSGMPLDAMNNTVRVFLGTQIGCAQCHNHPIRSVDSKRVLRNGGVHVRNGNAPGWK